MNCADYIENFLAAHADGELDGGELRAAEEHLARCAKCRELLAQERAIKELVRARVGVVRTPAELRAALRSALDSVDAGDAPGRVRAGVKLRSPGVWVPLALAAGIALFMLVPRALYRPSETLIGQATETPNQVPLTAGGVPEFDVAIAAIETFNARFEPNVPSDSFGHISNAFLRAKMPGLVLNFMPAGFKLIGGRLDRMPDGRVVTRTFYRGERGLILCSRFRAEGMQPPSNLDHEVEGHYYYGYRGYSICLSFDAAGRFVCLLVSSVPLQPFVQDVILGPGGH
ncbi:MAG: anti-sigma factor family protein [Candidatus Binataceae bacterium]